MTLPIVFRSQLSGPMSCSTYDANLLATLDRGNATGTQLANTISDLYSTVEGYDFITALQTCCSTLTTQLNTLQTNLFGNGELSTIISTLRTELLGDISAVQTSLNSLTTRLTSDEATIASFTSSISTLASAVAGLTTSKANINSPSFTGVPLAPTPTLSSNTSQIATVGFVEQYALPIGVVLPYGGGTAPNANFALAVGQAISRTTYAGLFAVFGTTYGAGDGSTTFNLPNLQQSIPVGVGTGYALGATGGEATHTLVTAEMPSHGHNNDPHGHIIQVNDPEHAHTIASGSGGDWYLGGPIDQPFNINNYANVQPGTGGGVPAGNSIIPAVYLGGETIIPNIEAPYGFSATYQQQNGWYGLEVNSTTGAAVYPYTTDGTSPKSAVSKFFSGMTTGASSTGITATTVTNGIVIDSTGGDQPHNNMQPYIVLNYIVKIL